MKINLKVKEGNKVETIQHEVEEVNLLQITRSIKVIKDVLKMAQDDPNLQALIVEIFEEVEGSEGDENTLENLDNGFVQKLIGAMDVLLAEVPDKAFELLSILSNIDQETFMQQKLEDALDIYDAIITVNDIDKLINRAKKSLALTKAQVKVMSIFQKKTQPELKQA